jgi:aminotransferase
VAINTLADRFVPARLRDFRPSQIGGDVRVRLLRMAAALTDVIQLNSGDPDFTAAPVAVEAAIDALRSGHTRYAIGGLPELRAAIARRLRDGYGAAMSRDPSIIITSGSAEALAAVFHTLLEPGDEVLTTNPYYNGHVSTIVGARGIPVLVPTTGDDLWEPDPKEVERRITNRTKAFIFASPGNPTAAVYRREVLQRLVEIAHEHDLLMIADELFDRYIYDNCSYTRIASLPGAYERVVTINGFSKSYCMTGWRVGWIEAPGWLAEPLSQVRYAMSMCAATPNQWGAAAALSDAAKPYYDDVYKAYGARRAFFYDAFTQMGLTQRPTPGGFVGMLDVRALGMTSAEAAETMLRDARVLTWPGNAFGSQGEGYLRIGLVEDVGRLQEVTRRIEPIVRRFL